MMEHNVNRNSGVIVIEGLFFMSLTTIRQNGRMVKEAFKDLYKIVSKN